MALREVEALIQPKAIRNEHSTLIIDQPTYPEAAKRLVYFASSTDTDNVTKLTQQSLLERVNGNGPNRQSTRYSVHGIHEYKGKFNPQIAKAMLNIFGAQPGHTALDPFCGSGTSLVECAHMGVSAVGADINPMAVLLANAKLKALGIPARDIDSGATLASKSARSSKYTPKSGTERIDYLAGWFSEEILAVIERLRIALDKVADEPKEILLVLASNLLRDYSHQDPEDLRIRRRKTPIPETPFLDAFDAACKAFCAKLHDSQETLGVINVKNKALLADCRKITPSIGLKIEQFDMALTSPPYATALPYIDTQRLSLVWLGLTPPSEILKLEATLVGSREIRGKNKKDLLELLEKNSAKLPSHQANLCSELQKSLTNTDGFRRQAVPRLLYRYFSGMADVFESVRPLMKPNAPFGLIVGGNHTVLGGKRFDIETPRHLTDIAVSRGWKHEETIELQTYKRFGVHAENATTTEAFIILRA